MNKEIVSNGFGSNPLGNLSTSRAADSEKTLLNDIPLIKQKAPKRRSTDNAKPTQDLFNIEERFEKELMERWTPEAADLLFDDESMDHKLSTFVCATDRTADNPLLTDKGKYMEADASPAKIKAANRIRVVGDVKESGESTKTGQDTHMKKSKHNKHNSHIVMYKVIDEEYPSFEELDGHLAERYMVPEDLEEDMKINTPYLTQETKVKQFSPLLINHLSSSRHTDGFPKQHGELNVKDWNRIRSFTPEFKSKSLLHNSTLKNSQSYNRGRLIVKTRCVT